MKRYYLILNTIILMSLSCSIVTAQTSQNTYEVGASYNIYDFGAKPSPRSTGPGLFLEYRREILSYLSVGAHTDYMYSREGSSQVEDTHQDSSTYNQFSLQAIANLHLPYSFCAISPFVSLQAGPGIGIKSASEDVAHSQRKFYIDFGFKVGITIKSHLSIALVQGLDYDPKEHYIGYLYSNTGLAVGYCF